MRLLKKLRKLSAYSRNNMIGYQVKYDNTHWHALTWRRYNTAMFPSAGSEEPLPEPLIRMESTTNEHSDASVRHSVTAIYLQWTLRVNYACRAGQITAYRALTNCNKKNLVRSSLKWGGDNNEAEARSKDIKIQSLS